MTINRIESNRRRAVDSNVSRTAPTDSPVISGPFPAVTSAAADVWKTKTIRAARAGGGGGGASRAVASIHKPCGAFACVRARAIVAERRETHSGESTATDVVNNINDGVIKRGKKNNIGGEGGKPKPKPPAAATAETGNSPPSAVRQGIRGRILFFIFFFHAVSRGHISYTTHRENNIQYNTIQ